MDDPSERIRHAKPETCFECNGQCPYKSVLDAVEEMLDSGRLRELDELLAARLKPAGCGTYRRRTTVYKLPCEP